MLTEYIEKLMDGLALAAHEAEEAMGTIMEGEATATQIGAFLAVLRLKGETADEVLGCAQALRSRATPLGVTVEKAVDVCGTGGDMLGTFNVSTTTAFVVAGAGVPVAKHGNRSVSSKCGSADVLEASGINITMEPDQAAACLAEHGITFLFAPIYHRAMQHAAIPRRELGFRTVFNLLGPLCNPLPVTRQVVGVYDRMLTEPIAQVLARLGSHHALVVHALDGLDEISISSPTQVTEVQGGMLHTYRINPQELGFGSRQHGTVTGGDAQTNRDILLAVLRGEGSACRDMVLLNAAAGLVVGGAARDFTEGIALARNSIDSGAALEKWSRLREFSRRAS